MIFLLFFAAVLTVSFLIILLLTGESKWEKKVKLRVDSLQLARRRNQHPEEDTKTILKQETVSLFPWLDQVLGRYRFSHGLKTLFVQAGSPWTLGTFVLYSVGGGALAFLPTYLFLPLLPIDGMLAVGGLCAPYLYLRFQRTRRVRTFNKGLPNAIDLMARALHAGHSLAYAIEVLSEQADQAVAVEFLAVFRQQNFGLPMRDALLQLADRVPSKDLRFLVTAMLVQKETGGNLMEILDRTSYVIRERLRIEGEVRTHTAQGRMTGWILSLLPIILLALLSMIDPGYAGILLKDPTGQKLLCAGAGLIVLGGLIIRKIVDIQV